MPLIKPGTDDLNFTPTSIGRPPSVFVGLAGVAEEGHIVNSAVPKLTKGLPVLVAVYVSPFTTTVYGDCPLVTVALICNCTDSPTQISSSAASMAAANGRLTVSTATFEMAGGLIPLTHTARYLMLLSPEAAVNESVLLLAPLTGVQVTPSGLDSHDTQGTGLPMA